jgi:hypothetical protein
MRKPVLAFAAGLACVSALALPCAAQESITLNRLADIQSGAYTAGDNVHFTLVAHNGNFLLRFDNDPEVYVLYSGRVSMGGRVLKYDCGDTALQVSGWGGITLYTDAKPNGLPAVRNGDAQPIVLQPVSLTQMQSAAADEADSLAYTRRVNVTFTADWPSLANDTNARALALDSMENAARGLSRMAQSAPARAMLNQHITVVAMASGRTPTISLNSKTRTLTVTFNPGRSYEGRASSRAIAHALGGMLKSPSK